MKIRLFIGTNAVKTLFKEWLFYTYPNCQATETALIDCRTYFKDLSLGTDLETLSEFLDLASYIPKINNEQLVLNIFITESQLPNLELQERLAKFLFPIHYYQVGLVDADTLSIKFHHESSSYFYSSDSFRLAGIQYRKNKGDFELHPFRFSLGTAIIETKFLRPYIKKVCSNLLYANNNSKPLDILIREATSGRPALQYKILNLIRTNDKRSLAAMSYLRLWQYYPEHRFDENLFFTFLKTGRILPVYFDRRDKTRNLYQIISFKKLLRLLLKEKQNLRSYLSFEDTVNLASHYIENFFYLKEMLLTTRIRSLKQVHDLLSDESYYQRIFYEEKVAQSFSELQKTFLKLNQKNFVVPQNLPELRSQAKIFKNCSILYARDVANSRGFLGYIYKEDKPFACVFFDHYRNIIEVSGIANRSLNELERAQVQEHLYYGQF